MNIVWISGHFRPRDAPRARPARIAPHGPSVPTRVPKALKVLPSIK